MASDVVDVVENEDDVADMAVAYTEDEDSDEDDDERLARFLRDGLPAIHAQLSAQYIALTELLFTDGDGEQRTVASEWFRHQLALGPHAFYEAFRMEQPAFMFLLEACRRTGKMRRWIHNNHSISDVDDLGVTLFFLAHGCTTRQLQYQFGISKSYAHACLRPTLQAISFAVATMPFCSISFGDPAEEERDWVAGKRDGDTRFAHLKGCVCAGDCTMIPYQGVTAKFNAARWRGYKNFTAANMLVLFKYNLHAAVTYVGIEGSAFDSTSFNTVNCQHAIPDGYFGLFDAGFPLVANRCLVPYRGTRYHLKEWTAEHRPTTKQELFNLRHCVQRVKAEIGFGRLKARWRILRNGIVGDEDLLLLVSQATLSLHNYVEYMYGQETTRSLADRARRQETAAHLPARPPGARVTAADESGDGWRDRLAQEAWDEYQRRGGRGPLVDVPADEVAAAREMNDAAPPALFYA